MSFNPHDASFVVWSRVLGRQHRPPPPSQRRNSHRLDLSQASVWVGWKAETFLGHRNRAPFGFDWRVSSNRNRRNFGSVSVGEETCAWTSHTRCCCRRTGMKLTLKTVAGKQFQVEAEAEETVRGPFAAGARRRSECTRRSVAEEGLGRPRRSLDRRNGVGATLTRQTCRWLKSSRRCKTCKEMRCLKKGKS